MRIDMPEPTDLVTLQDISQALGAPYSTVDAWHRRGLIHPAGREGRQYLFRWADIAALNYVSGESRSKKQPAPPDGYLTADDAAFIMGVSATQVRCLMRQGKIDGLVIPVQTINNKIVRYVYPLRSSVEDYAARHPAKAVAENPEAKIRGNPLICGNHKACLAARRKLWEERQKTPSAQTRTGEENVGKS